MQNRCREGGKNDAIVYACQFHGQLLWVDRIDSGEGLFFRLAVFSLLVYRTETPSSRDGCLINSCILSITTWWMARAFVEPTSWSVMGLAKRTRTTFGRALRAMSMSNCRAAASFSRSRRARFS